MKIILDTNIYISQYVFQGVSQKVVNMIIKENYSVQLSTELFLEIKSKFLDGRVKKLQKSNFDENRVIDFLETITNSTVHTDVISNTKHCRDPKDNMIVNYI
jgi:putative PIN family toxin of toxin-antitoxin system